MTVIKSLIQAAFDLQALPLGGLLRFRWKLTPPVSGSRVFFLLFKNTQGKKKAPGQRPRLQKGTVWALRPTYWLCVQTRRNPIPSGSRLRSETHLQGPAIQSLYDRKRATVVSPGNVSRATLLFGFPPTFPFLSLLPPHSIRCKEN